MVVQISISKFATEVNLNMLKGYWSRGAKDIAQIEVQELKSGECNITFHQQNFKVQSLERRSKYRSVHY